jgi:mono/diheme cytochrome c family protein
LSSSLTENIVITNGGTLTTQTWYYPSPSDCLQCHTPVANYVLGVSTRQLNNQETYPGTGVMDNELRTLNRLGLLNPAFNETNIAGFEALSSLTNTSASYQERARSYLDANCAQCHQPGGNGPTFDARYDTPLASQNITNYPATALLGYDNTCIIKADDVWRSAIYDRMNTTNNQIKMPPLARNLVDTNGVAVMADWINSLPGTPALPPPTITPNGGMFFNSVGITLQATSNAAIYYTLNGVLPTTNSVLYTGAFNLTNGSAATVSVAIETNFNNSVAASALFTVLPMYFPTPGLYSNGVYQMEFAGVPGSNYVLEATTNFVTWTPLLTNQASNTLFYIVDTNASSFKDRFYRVLQP